MKICSKCQSTYPDEYSICPHDGVRLAAQFTGTEAQVAAQLAGRFRMLHRLGKGGFGTVFLAEQMAVGNRLVALKVLSGQPLSDPKYFKRFQDEAASAGRIQHPNVVTIHDYGQADDGTPYIAMEFLKGQSLRDTLRERGRLGVAEVVEILQQAARGLNAAHKLGIIHRDLKPENIFLSRDDDNELTVKIVDFGIVKLLESAGANQSTGLVGTPAYMSYDQLSNTTSDKLDARSDVYSLGVVVYEMLTGRVPFHSDTQAGFLGKHLSENPPPFATAAPDLDVPQAVESVVMKALVKDRDRRQASALEFAREFAQAAEPAPPAEISKPLPPTVIVSPLTSWKSGAATPSGGNIAVQPSLSALPERIVGGPRPQPPASRPGEAPSRQAAAKPPQFQTISEPPGKMKFIVSAVATLILIIAGVWYVSQPAHPPVVTPPVVTQQADEPPMAAPSLVAPPVHAPDRDTPNPKPAQAPAPETGYLRISCDRPCSLTLDGSLQGQIESGRSTDLTLSNGRHVVEASDTNETGIPPQQKQITIYPSKTNELNFSFSSELATRSQQIAEGLRRAKEDEQNLEFHKAFEEYNRLAKLDKDNQDVRDLKQELQNLCADHPDLDCPK